ncbi:MAG: hypothetical protein VYC39_16220 [Myxococcota bacterium]|nr:hypothetical protein [Myxococcota bacterium]
MNLEELLQITPWIHASFGIICIFSGLLALTAKKRRGRHSNAGRIFAVSLTFAFAAILLNLIIRKNVFMFGLGWLAVYTGIEGWRALLRFKGSLPQQPTVFDYLFGSLTLLISVGLFVFGVRVFIQSKNPMGFVCILFGVLGVSVLRKTWQRYKTIASGKKWLKFHIDMMLAAFSAAVTAFLAVQFSGHLGDFEWVVWVTPTLVLSRYGSYEAKRRGLRATQ